MNPLQEALERSRKFAEPTPEELGLPREENALYMLLYSCEAPQKAQRAYWKMLGNANEEADARQRAREVRAKVNGTKRRSAKA